MKSPKNIIVALALLAVVAAAFVWLKEAPPKTAGPETARPKISGPVDLASVAPMAIDEEMITYHLDRMSIDIPESFGPPKFSFTFGLNAEPRQTVITLSEFSTNGQDNANRLDELTAQAADEKSGQIGKPSEINEFAGHPARIISWFDAQPKRYPAWPDFAGQPDDWPNQHLFKVPQSAVPPILPGLIKVFLFVEYSDGYCRYELEHLADRTLSGQELEAELTALENKLLELVKTLDYQWLGKNQAPEDSGRSATALGSVKWPADAPGPDMAAELSFAPDYEDTENFVFEAISAARKSEAAEAAANRNVGGRPGLESKLAEPHNDEMLKARFKFSEAGQDAKANQRLQEVKMNVLVDVYTEENLPYLLGLWDYVLNSVRPVEEERPGAPESID